MKKKTVIENEKKNSRIEVGGEEYSNMRDSRWLLGVQRTWNTYWKKIIKMTTASGFVTKTKQQQQQVGTSTPLGTKPNQRKAILLFSAG